VKGINRGWAKPDDPMYSSGVMATFRSPLMPSIGNSQKSTDGAQPLDLVEVDLPEKSVKPTVSPSREVVTVASGRYAVICDFLSWDAGSCLDIGIPQFALCASLDDAHYLFESRSAFLASELKQECDKVEEISDLPWMGQSGYTTYCILFEADESYDAAGWQRLFGNIYEDGPAEIAKLIRRFDGRNASDGFIDDAIQFQDIERHVCWTI